MLVPQSVSFANRFANTVTRHGPVEQVFRRHSR
jgi:hypothetical protein